MRHHVKEEERDTFPKVRKALGTSALRSLGERMEEAKGIVPRSPHPRMPDEPPGNVVAGSAMALLDLAREAVSAVRARSVATEREPPRFPRRPSG